MTFREAYLKMLQGYKVTRPGWKGYWYFNGRIGKIVIHLAEGSDVIEGDFTLCLQNALAEDWATLDEY